MVTHHWFPGIWSPATLERLRLISNSYVPLYCNRRRCVLEQVSPERQVAGVSMKPQQQFHRTSLTSQSRDHLTEPPGGMRPHRATLIGRPPAHQSSQRPGGTDSVQVSLTWTAEEWRHVCWYMCVCGGGASLVGRASTGCGFDPRGPLLLSPGWWPLNVGGGAREGND